MTQDNLSKNEFSKTRTPRSFTDRIGQTQKFI